MNIETWITLAISIVVVPSVAWLVKEVLDLRGRMIGLEARMSAREETCERHQKWNGELQRSLTRMDKNIAKLCLKAGIPESE